jgi:hypothetical protein
MKIGMTAFILALTLTSALAQELKLQEGDIGIGLAESKIIALRPICTRLPGEYSCLGVGSHVTVEMKLNGCFDRFGGHHSRFELQGNKGILHFQAFSISTQDSKDSECDQRPVEKVTLFVPFEGKLELRALEFTPVEF